MIESKLLKCFEGYIGGRWTGANGVMPVFDPATGEKLADVPNMGAAETLSAIESAQAALNSPASISERRRRLESIADLLAGNREELGRIITLENGKPMKESVVEVDYSIGFFRYYAASIDALEPHRLKERPRNHDWTVHYRPAGVAGLITPWNFPLAMIAKKLSAALAAGCPSVIKPSEKTPLSLIALIGLLEKLDLPAGAVNLVIGDPKPIGDVLCEHPAVSVISFTGSTAVGKYLLAATAPHVKKLALELGGNAPFIVFADADLDAAADHLIQNKFRCAGQTCVCANRIYVQRDVAVEFTRKVVERVSKLKVGNGLDPATDIGPLIDRAAFEKVDRHVRDAIEKGATLLIGGEPETAGQFFPPTVLSGVTQQMACAREETFGPVVPIIQFESEAEAIEWSNQTEYGLASYFFTRDVERAERIARGLRFGHAGCNTGTGPTPEAPFGGMKQSGIGREGGIEGLFEFVEPQTVPHGVPSSDG